MSPVKRSLIGGTLAFVVTLLIAILKGALS